MRLRAGPPTRFASRADLSGSDAPTWSNFCMAATKHIGIVLFSDVEELDALGPWEVLATWTHFFPEDGYAVSCLSRSGGLVQCAKGLVVQAHHSFADAPPLDVLVYPGGKGTRPQLQDDGQLGWVRRQRATVPLMSSVCTGSLVYAAAGLLSHRPATTHWASLDLLAELDPTIDVRRDDRFVDDGDIITASGVSAGIDMALHLIVRLAGAERARQVRKAVQYDPAPPV
jgi:transcriptional regulator GlxA family with amidase domain